MTRWIGAIAAALTLSVPAHADDKAPAVIEAKPIPVYLLHETSINFADRNSIQDFEAMSDRVVFVQARDRQWYRVKTTVPCFGLDRAINIAFIANGDGHFDKFSYIHVNGQRCQLESVAQSDRPWTRQDLVRN